MDINADKSDWFEETVNFLKKTIGVDITKEIGSALHWIINKWDKATILGSVPVEESDVTTEDIACLRTALQRGRLIDPVPRIQIYLDQLENAELNIAVTGESGAGKSSFINAMRGIRNGARGAAKTGVTETTLEPTPYEHPNNPNTKYWDLPGTGTPNFKEKTFLKKVNFQKYDFFIIISSERFRQNDVMLAKEIKKMKKNVYFVRSKMDNDMESCKECEGPEFDEEMSLRSIREYCESNLKKLGINPPCVFLISNVMKHWGKYDFKQLIETMERELPSIKRHAFLLSMSNHSLCLIQKKKKRMQWKIWLYALVACVFHCAPIPCIPSAINFAFVRKVESDIRKNFNLDDESLSRLAKNANIPVEELKALMETPNEDALSPETVIAGILGGAFAATMPFTAQFIKESTAEVVKESAISIFKALSPIAAFSFAYIVTCVRLQMFLNKSAKDAERVLNKVYELRAVSGEGENNRP